MGAPNIVYILSALTLKRQPLVPDNFSQRFANSSQIFANFSDFADFSLSHWEPKTTEKKDT